MSFFFSASKLWDSSRSRCFVSLGFGIQSSHVLDFRSFFVADKKPQLINHPAVEFQLRLRFIVFLVSMGFLKHEREALLYVNEAQ